MAKAKRRKESRKEKSVVAIVARSLSKEEVTRNPFLCWHCGLRKRQLLLGSGFPHDAE